MHALINLYVILSRSLFLMLMHVLLPCNLSRLVLIFSIVDDFAEYKMVARNKLK